MTNADPSVVRGYVHGLFHSLEETEMEFAKSELRTNELEGKLCRLRICRDFLLAAECCRKCDNSKLELLCILRIFEKLQPFLLKNSKPPIVVHILYRCHEALLRLYSVFGEDTPKGMKDYLVPIAYHLVQALVEHSNYHLALQISYETVTLINVVAHNIDNRIMNSSHFETSVLGYQFKPHKGKAKRGSAQYLFEFGFHGLLAVTKSHKVGLSITRKQFDVFYEQVELMLIKTKAALSLTDPNQKKNLYVNRKSLDNFTTLRELYQLYASSGPETTMQELNKFRKNPRYVELVSEILSWCLEKEQLDVVVKIANEVEDWVDKRTQVILRMDELMQDSVSQKKDIVIKRRKRPLFALDKIEQLLAASKAKQYLVIT
jgi:cell fate (sporulation/competence/biofilm development) regulator YlbF (YheA/YmcA/DUF963 family)